MQLDSCTLHDCQITNENGDVLRIVTSNGLKDNNYVTIAFDTMGAKKITISIKSYGTINYNKRHSSRIV